MAPAGQVKKKRNISAKGGRDKAAFAETFAALKKILLPYEKALHVDVDKPDYYAIVTHEPLYKGKPLFFGAVRAGKAYVSYHLFSLYMNPKLGEKLSPALKKRMQGKTCFNFTSPDPVLFKELATITAASFRFFQDKDALRSLLPKR